jgi:hypothetical protein
MPSPRRIRAIMIFALGVCLLASACSTGPLKSLRNTARLRQQLIDKYHEQDINVSLRNSRFLFIAFVNSPLNKNGPAERARRAQETATFTASNFPTIKEIETIGVSFVAAESRFFVYHYNKNLGFFSFDRYGVAVNSSGSDEDPRQPVVRFNSARNETDVSITRLQLEGDMNHGIALVPHFTLKGNLRDANRSLPESVVFDFASYADSKVFPADARLDIRCDEVGVFSGSARLLTPQDSGSEGSTAQFLTAQIPVPQFSKMGTARQVKLKLGSKDFELSTEDVKALRTMSGYLSQPHEEMK